MSGTAILDAAIDYVNPGTELGHGATISSMRSPVNLDRRDAVNKLERSAPLSPVRNQSPKTNEILRAH
eukprot:236719-Rhodomonas_salina.2